jgi:hypothetical protein
LTIISDIFHRLEFGKWISFNDQDKIFLKRPTKLELFLSQI